MKNGYSNWHGVEKTLQKTTIRRESRFSIQELSVKYCHLKLGCLLLLLSEDAQKGCTVSWISAKFKILRKRKPILLALGFGNTCSHFYWLTFYWLRIHRKESAFGLHLTFHHLCPREDGRKQERPVSN